VAVAMGAACAPRASPRRARAIIIRAPAHVGGTVQTTRTAEKGKAAQEANEGTRSHHCEWEHEHRPEGPGHNLASGDRWPPAKVRKRLGAKQMQHEQSQGLPPGKARPRDKLAKMITN